jgi:hypothetical protein
MKRAQRKELAMQLLERGESCIEIAKATGYTMGYIYNLSYGRRNPGKLDESQKVYRQNNPEKIAGTRSVSRRKNQAQRNKQRHDNYHQTAFARNSHQEWTVAHLERITSPDRPCDRVLSKEMGRSVSSIQTQRYFLKKKLKDA